MISKATSVTNKNEFSMDCFIVFNNNLKAVLQAFVSGKGTGLHICEVMKFIFCF